MTDFDQGYQQAIIDVINKGKKEVDAYLKLQIENLCKCNTNLNYANAIRDFIFYIEHYYLAEVVHD